MHVCVTLSFLLFLFYIFCFNLSALQTDIAFYSVDIITFVIGNLKKFFFPHPLSGTTDSRNFGVKLSFRLWERIYSYALPASLEISCSTFCIDNFSLKVLSAWKIWNPKLGIVSTLFKQVQSSSCKLSCCIYLSHLRQPATCAEQFPNTEEGWSQISRSRT